VSAVFQSVHEYTLQSSFRRHFNSQYGL